MLDCPPLCTCTFFTSSRSAICLQLDQKFILEVDRQSVSSKIYTVAIKLSKFIRGSSALSKFSLPEYCKLGSGLRWRLSEVSICHRLMFKYCKLHCVSKNDTDVAHYDFNAHQPISLIFGRDTAERICY